MWKKTETHPFIDGSVVVEQHHRKVGTIEGAHDGVHAGFLLDTHGEHEEVALGAVRVVRGGTFGADVGNKKNA